MSVWPTRRSHPSIVTVLVPAETGDLTTLETLKEELGLSLTDTTQDAKLGRWIHEASSQIATYTNRSFGRETVSEVFSLGDNPGYTLVLSRRPVAMINSVVQGTMTLDPGSYDVNMAAGVIYRTAPGMYWDWHAQITVEYQAGYDLIGELPYDIERACLRMVQYRQLAGARDPTIRSEALIGVYSTTYATVAGAAAITGSLPEDVASLLSPYMDYPIV